MNSSDQLSFSESNVDSSTSLPKSNSILSDSEVDPFSTSQSEKDKRKNKELLINKDDDQNVDPEATSVVSSQHRSQFHQFLSSLASFTGDLSQLTCPSFLLSGVSLLEYCVHWCDHPDLFMSIPLIQSPLERILQITKWFLSTLYGAYHSRCKDGTEKKPYNPILGERFKCSWSNELRLTCEQVSHHPPVSGFHLSNHPSQPTILLTGHCGQKSKFKTTYFKVTQEGRAILHLPTFNESILITLPGLAVRGLLTGKVFIELDSPCYIYAPDSKYWVHLEFLPKPWFTGEYHRFQAHVYSMVTELKEVQWQGRWTHQSTDSQGTLILDHTLPPQSPTVPPLESQAENESRKVWHK
ncbi:Oxysterol binding protein, partial [Coelomomyces lativittatus]